MKDQYQNERLNNTSSQQLELALHDGDNIICTRACEGVSGSTHHVDAEQHLREEDVPLSSTEASGARQNSTSDDENTLEQEVSDDKIEQDYEEEFECVSDDIYQRVMGALREALADAGVSEKRIAMHEDLVEGSLGLVIDLCLG